MAPAPRSSGWPRSPPREWAEGLIRSWDHWLDLPRRVGDRLAPIIGAPAGLGRRPRLDDGEPVPARPRRPGAGRRRGRPDGAIAVDDGDFPTDRYVVDGVAAATGRAVRHGLADLDGVAVVVRSAVDYRSAARADIAAETARATAAGRGHGVGPVARRRGRRGRRRRRRGRARRRVHVQVPARRAGRAGVVVRRAGAGGLDRAADLGLVRPGRAVRDGRRATTRSPTSAGCCSARRASSAWPPPRSASGTSPTPGWRPSRRRAGR